MTGKKRKGQEEIVGFVLIVVLIVIAFVIFLGIKLRSPEPAQRNSEIIYQFIESSMEQTTECAVRQNGKNLALGELIKECHSLDNTCLSGRTSCDEAEGTFQSLLDSSWKVGPDYPYKAYEITATYEYNLSGGGQNEEIFSIASGNCTANYIGNSYFIPEFPGSIVITAKFCL